MPNLLELGRQTYVNFRLARALGAAMRGAVESGAFPPPNQIDVEHPALAVHPAAAPEKVEPEPVVVEPRELVFGPYDPLLDGRRDYPMAMMAIQRPDEPFVYAGVTVAHN